MTQAKVIAIDGPSGSGKSTIAKILAKKLSLVYLDTGALYRGIAFVLNQNNIATSEEKEIETFLGQMNLEYAPSEDILIKINGEDLTEKIREHQVSALASQYSKIMLIRNYLKGFQRSLAQTRGAVLEGRDIGTVIFPDAALKIFLTADAKIRAQRRYDQLAELGQDMSQIDIAQIEADIIQRDEADQNRKIAPLKQADDAIKLDSTSNSIEEIVDQVISEYQNRSDLFA